MATAELLNPRAGLLRRRHALGPPAPLALVYRRRNVPAVLRLLAALEPGCRVALWGLDGVAGPLAELTVGSGPGERFALLNACIEQLRLQPEEWLVVSDDDVSLRRGSLGLAVDLAVASGMDLAQPAHSWRSTTSWSFTRTRLGSAVREVGWVEIGPVLLLGPRAQEAILPFPNGVGMGWGVDLDWSALRPHLRLGIIDAVLVDHLGQPGAAYRDGSEERTLQAALERHQLRAFSDVQKTVSTWAWWKRLPS